MHAAEEAADEDVRVDEHVGAVVEAGDTLSE